VATSVGKLDIDHVQKSEIGLLVELAIRGFSRCAGNYRLLVYRHTDISGAAKHVTKDKHLDKEPLREGPLIVAVAPN